MNDLYRLLGGVRATFEAAVIVVLQIIMMIVVAFAIFELCELLYQAITARFLGRPGPTDVADVHELQHALQRAFAGVLLVLLGLELFETLKTYFTQHSVRLEVILVIAIIAVARHIMVLDFEQVLPATLLAIGVLVLALTGGYFLVSRSSIAQSR